MLKDVKISKNIQHFYNVLNEFLSFIETYCSMYKNDIVIARSKINNFKKINPTIFIEEYVKTMTPFYNSVKTYNEDFIIEGKFQNDFLKKLRTIWLSKTLSKRQKAHIWYYLNQLIILGFPIIN
jgi:hypothetical protein